MHCAPVKPHAVFWLPTAQMSAPMQQPAQFAGLQPACGVQTPALHVSFAAQLWQAAPPLPHSAGVVATTQASPTQQPGHVAALQVTGALHVPALGWPGGMHVLPVAPQLVHCAPWVPHALASVPVTQTVPLQQPPQFSGPHFGVPWHCPPALSGNGVQLSPMSLQLTQAWPLSPHALLSLPGRH